MPLQENTRRMAATIDREAFYVGPMARAEAESRLRNDPVGTFIFRASETRDGLSMSIKTNDKIKHYMVALREDDRYVVVGKPNDFGSIRELIQFHSQVPPSETDGVLLLPPPAPPVPPPRGSMVDEDEDPYASLESTKVDASAQAHAKARAQQRLKEHQQSLSASQSSGKHAYEGDFTPLRMNKE
ncbi:uncharacterized protein MONBRDRAFT_26157 [Monosiga brevicollis MX1]|uniref:SH2 domain-containing protein n=1 Tax=Monosiga brevicollis TaxID=81824 RepID=A9V1J0_MONBE|nr:uncharacterized protein MONBRDRAFT_26157 [Monosiga brevicollis MX1]EDQ88575.1 predicted protein [Monosiga brevicollis MX1]|eukprot:XP_001746679.1 hypothetical protein [Monosiga brevicollis MX1]